MQTRVTLIVPSRQAGGIGLVCKYASTGLARVGGWDVTLLCLHDAEQESIDPASGLRHVALGLRDDCPSQILAWIKEHPQDIVVTSDVALIEPAFPFIPASTAHVVHVHDSFRRYREVAVRNREFIDGVVCVGRHIERPLRKRLEGLGYKGLLTTVHNGAEFPSERPRLVQGGPLRLLFLGRLDPQKGVTDLVPILDRLRKRRVAVTLDIVGGHDDSLRERLARRELESTTTWHGRVPQARCYDIAAESDILLMPSRREAFGMVTIEAMSMGAVPIAYAAPSGSSEIIEHGRSGILVRIGDFDAWATAIEALSSDRDELARLSRGAVVRARTHFNAGVMADSLSLFLRDVMANSRVHPADRRRGRPQTGLSGGRRFASPYQLLPRALRDRVRRAVLSNPTLSHWVLRG